MRDIMNKVFVFESESTLTDRYQTTIPETVRRALRLGKRDKIRYKIEPSGKVVLSRGDGGEQDPVLGKFIDFIARDIQEHPDTLQALDSTLAHHLQSLTDGVSFDLNDALPEEEE